MSAMHGAPADGDPLLVDVEGYTALLLGNEAIARGALEAGVAFACGYPGTPSSEVTDSLARVARARRIIFEYSVNEKVAIESAFAASLSGARSIVAMKHLGLSYGADPLSTIPYVGTVAGMVIVGAGDPSCHTSSNEQDQRWLGPMFHLPMLDPAAPQDALAMTRAAFDVSEKSRLPVVVRPTTRVCHARAPVRCGRLRDARVAGFERDRERFVPVPANARRMRREIGQRLEVAGALLRRAGLVRRTGSARAGVVTSGGAASICASIVEEHDLARDLSVLELGVVHPLPTEACAEFLASVDRVLVVEELSPFLEDALRALAGERALRIEILGKRTGHLPIAFEYTPDIVARAMRHAFGFDVAPSVPPVVVPDEAPARPAILCAGCGHRSTYMAAKAALGADTLFFNDIGCYTLGHDPPLEAADALLCMGAGISMAAAASRVTGKRTVGFVGDSTFFHSGMPALLDAVKEGASVVVVVLDNQVAAMTGFQESPCVHVRDHEPARDVSIEGVARALGVRHVERIDPYDLAAATIAFERARDAQGVSVIVAERPCPVFLARQNGVAHPSPPYQVDDARCRSCGRAALGFRCDVPTTPGYERHLARTRGLDRAPVAPRPDVAPCSARCPLFLCVQGYAGHIAAGEYAHALSHVVARVALPESVCRVCDRPCETACARSGVDEPIAINDLKRFVVQRAAADGAPYAPARDPDNGLRVAVVGAGPSGLAAAHDLRLRGYAVTIFDAAEEPGGLLRTAIPEFRLPRAALDRDVARVLSLGIRFAGGRKLGADLRIATLLAEGYGAVYVAVGAGRALSLDLANGEAGAPVVQSGLAYLRAARRARGECWTGADVVVVGGGNAGIDVARTARRLGAQRVTVACPETRERMPALADEILAAEQEGIVVLAGVRPDRIVRGSLTGLAFEGGQPVAAEQILVAIGQTPDDFLASGDLALDRNTDGTLRIDPETCRTSHARVFAGGDVVRGERTVTAAMAWGQRAAWGIDSVLRGADAANTRRPPPRPGTLPADFSPAPERADRSPRRCPPHLSARDRVASFDEVAGVLGEDEARAEAARCMACGSCGNCRSCIEVFGCPAFHVDRTDAARIRIDPALCIGCGVCAAFCPDAAIGRVEDGQWRA